MKIQNINTTQIFNISEWLKEGEKTIVQCELTLAELRMLYLVTRTIAGCPTNSPRKYSDTIYRELNTNQLIASKQARWAKNSDIFESYAQTLTFKDYHENQ